MPSAAVLARDFNFRSSHTQPISAETARRWIRGLSMPEMERLTVLIDWLGMRVDFLNEPQRASLIPDSNGSFYDSKRSQEAGLKPEEMELVRIYRTCDESMRRTMLAIAHAIQKNLRP